MAKELQFDVVVIGSGFGGSVTALRLREKGYSVAVLEAGKRFADKDFPKTSWRVNKFLFAPALGCFGIQRIHILPDVLVLCGAGVGGGSLVYASTNLAINTSKINSGQISLIGNANSNLGMNKPDACWELKRILTSRHPMQL
jgi:nucleoside-diphosphate-sugar epimerase